MNSTTFKLLNKRLIKKKNHYQNRFETIYYTDIQ